ncbi:hypothetical protein ACFX13_040378 [Malus domestica]
MAQGVLFNIADRISGRLGSLAFQEIGLIWGVQDELQTLKEIVAGFQVVLHDAEQKQANNEVKMWLQSVEDAVYEADDLLDEFNVEAQWREMVPESTKVSKKENIIGRYEDKMAIIQLLLDPISTENVSTISIVGFGGLGKTALAQLIFNNELQRKSFNISEHNGIEQLQNDLRRKVDGKKYLLVLDDVWNENREKWLSLKYLLMGGGKGSRILITTCSEIVATVSNTAKPYTLRGLNEEQSWSLFKEMALKDGKELENSTIKAVGKEIARKCQGVPLAIRTIGRMLHTKHHETEWLNFKEKKLSKISQEENDILPTLKLSYDVLPSHLKHCFAFCLLFPPDYEISVHKLIKLWVAQGFIKSLDENECLEDVVYEYY